MSNPYREKLLTIGVISRRTRALITEGRQHPETGVAWKKTETEAGFHVEHNTKDDRVDAVARPETVHVSLQRKGQPDGG